MSAKLPRLAVFVTVVLLLTTIKAEAQFYKQANLVSDAPGIAQIQDPLLINPWGVSFSSTSPFWISDQGTSKATVYRVDPVTGAATKVGLTVSLPGPPTGQVFNGSTGFSVSLGTASGPAGFLFSTLAGTIAGWNSGVPPPAPSMQAEVGATGATGSVYTGLAMAPRGANLFLYAADPVLGRVDVFDSTFAATTVPGAFSDPGLPAGDKPFDVVNVGGNLYVTYLGPSPAVNEFNTDGTLIRRFATGGMLLNPWGVTVAPANFGRFSNALLIGNFNYGPVPGTAATGPGYIGAFDATAGTFLGLLEDTAGNALNIDGLWALTPGNDHSAGRSDHIYFTAGVQEQLHGLFGSLEACHGPALSSISASPDVLWPPNHKMVPVAIGYTVSDNCDPAPVCALSVSSNEGSSTDWQIIDPHDVLLRSERSGNGGDRIYTVTADCTDQQHFSQSGTATVTVPHDQGHREHPRR